MLRHVERIIALSMLRHVERISSIGKGLECPALKGEVGKKIKDL